MTLDILDVNKNPPEGVIVLPNGAWSSKETGKIVRAAPGQLWDSKKASEMAKLRWEKVREKTREGIQKAVQEKDPDKVINDFPDAHGEVVEVLMTDVVLNDKQKGKTRVDGYKTILEIEGSVKSASKIDLAGGAQGVTIHFSNEVAKLMMDRLLERKSQPEQAPPIIEIDS
jgi:hypothetical protein